MPNLSIECYSLQRHFQGANCYFSVYLLSWWWRNCQNLLPHLIFKGRITLISLLIHPLWIKKNLQFTNSFCTTFFFQQILPILNRLVIFFNKNLLTLVTVRQKTYNFKHIFVMAFYTICGMPDCPQFAHACYVAQYLFEHLPNFKYKKVEKSKRDWPVMKTF